MSNFFNIFKLGITGGIGSGKTYIARKLSMYGINVIDTDIISNKINSEIVSCKKLIKKNFGNKYLLKNGFINKNLIRNLIFSNLVYKNKIEKILHPLILISSKTKSRFINGPYLILVIPLFKQRNFCELLIDRLCIIDCDNLTQLFRLKLRKDSSAIYKKIILQQFSRKMRLSYSNDIIYNGYNILIKEIRFYIKKKHEKWKNFSYNNMRLN